MLSIPVKREFRVKIGKFIDEIDETLSGLQAQVASLRRWVLVEHKERLCHISNINAANVVGFHVKLLAWIQYVVYTLHSQKL
jgi:hypothetical protein